MENATIFSKAYPLSILIAENNPEAQAMTKDMLHQLGYQPEIAADHKEVLQMTTVKAYDIILMDINMPGLEGMIPGQLGSVQARKPLIIAMTGDEALNYRQVCLQAAMDHSISKPVDPKEFCLQLMACSVLTGNCRIA